MAKKPEQNTDKLSEERLSACEQILQYEFKDRDLLVTSLTHASIAKSRITSNERLEFLGDSILGAVVCELLFERYPEDDEGPLTRFKSDLVSRSTCAEIAKKFQLDDFLRIGKGLTLAESIPSSVMAGVYEAVIGAIYLDGGYDAARAYIIRTIQEELDLRADTVHLRNSKSILQQLTQKKNGETPTYALLEEKGPDHLKCFKVSAVIGDQNFEPAWGANKKEAEQRAALNALYKLQGKATPFVDDQISVDQR